MYQIGNMRFSRRRQQATIEEAIYAAKKRHPAAWSQDTLKSNVPKKVHIKNNKITYEY